MELQGNKKINNLKTSRSIGQSFFNMETTEHIGHIISIHNSYGVVYSNTNNEEYYYKLGKENENLKVTDKVIFLVGMDRFSIDENAFALRKIFINTKGIIFYSRVNQEHIHLNLDNHFQELIEEIKDTEKEFVEIEHVFPDIIGKSSCVEVTANDKIIYAIRNGRNKHTKFVLGRKKTPCNSLFAVFKRTEFGYLILTIFIGKKAGREPWDKFATKEDVRFWNNHALIYDTNGIIRNSVVSKCPW